MFAEDLEDVYHISIFSSCTGRPMWSQVFVVYEHVQVAQQ
jgi:hypothetical protein